MAGITPTSANLFLWGVAEKMNIEHRTSNAECEKMKKPTYDLEERLLE